MLELFTVTSVGLSFAVEPLTHDHPFFKQTLFNSLYLSCNCVEDLIDKHWAHFYVQVEFEPSQCFHRSQHQ